MLKKIVSLISLFGQKSVATASLFYWYQPEPPKKNQR
ncbi:MAG: cyclic lactone autoinducer peptide [archaeon]